MGEAAKLRLVDIPETLVDPKTDNGRIAAGIREGRRRERADEAQAKAKREGEHAGQLAGVKSAHIDELNRSARIIAKAAHRDGMLQGTVLGALLVALLCFGAWVILKETVLLNTATQRVNYPNPPVLQDNYDGAVTYERNPREPRDAP